jgi:flagellar motility protein MotE (MotC chaperone)
MYSNMKPPQAAKVFETMDEDLVVEILGRMKKKNAADIMNLLKPEKAQIISEKYAGYKRSPASAR